ncbi:MAG TPA: hypothetical protein VKR82_05445 [Candidatus Acidoferrales bacterium]|nr:hypothetical protein [Candidatus Acidoferrales bacterium]
MSATTVNSGASRLPQFEKLRRGTLFAGIMGMVVSIPGLFSNPQQFFRSYLVAFVFWMGIPLGCLALLMMHHLTGGGWGYLIRRALESGTRTLWLMAILYLPLIFGMTYLYGWARPDAAADPAYVQKHFYLNTPFFLTRSMIYFVVWVGLALLLNRWSSEQDGDAAQTGVQAAASAKRLEGLSGPGLILWGMMVTFSSIDWVMSLEPTWFSSIYGMLIMVVQALSAMAFVVLVTRRLADREPLARIATKQRFNDLGNLLLTFVMLWAYLSFSQFLIIWSGNMPEETSWYMSRARGSWAALAVILIILHFAVPFFLLLSRDVKRVPGALSWVAGLLVALTLVDVFWLVAPAFDVAGPRVHWTNLTLVTGLGGLWIWAFFSQLQARPLLPMADPGLAEFLVEHAEGH